MSDTFTKKSKQMSLETLPDTLIAGFLASAKKFPNRKAMEIKSAVITYQQLQDACVRLASLIRQMDYQHDYITLFSSRSLAAYQGILASLYEGKAYLPVDLNSPVTRIIDTITAARSTLFVVDSAAVDLLESCIAELEASIFIFPQMEVPACFEIYKDKHQFFGLNDVLTRAPSGLESNDSAEQKAYLLFTSGSTGNPKGVPIANKNIVSYIRAIAGQYPQTEHDRVSQAFDLTFDPSLQDMFVTWFSGATLCVMDERDRLGAAYFIRKNKITVWNTIPSIAKLIMQTRSFSEKYFSELKYIFFNGELLSQVVAESSQLAAPNASVVNLYGLTETSVNIAHYLWDSKKSPEDCIAGVVPLGRLLPEHGMMIAETDKAGGTRESAGELYLLGPQIFAGYLNPEIKDFEAKNSETKGSEVKNSVPKASYFFYGEEGECYLKTGDLVLVDENSCLHFSQRLDDQVKIRGFRIELNEVRSVLELASSCPDALVLKAQDEHGEDCLLGFLKGQDFDLAAIKQDMLEKLPPYMQANDIIVLDEYPYLSSGKVDRKRLLQLAANTH